MDHFPPVSNPYNTVQIPYLGGEYDGEGFAGYPARQRWDLGKLQAGDLQGRTMAEAGAFLQTWLYFGMMHGVLGVHMRTTDFVRVGDFKKRFVTTHRLRRYLQAWKSQVDQERTTGTDDVLVNRNKRAVACLTDAYNFWFTLGRDERDRLVGPEIGLSIQILASTLEHAVSSVCEVPVKDLPWRLERNDFLTQRMIDYGWCPSVVDQICAANHLAFQYYASLLAAPSDPKRHGKCQAGDHGCSAKNVGDAKYVMKHRLPDVGCEILKVDLDALRDIIREGGIPLLHLEHKGSHSAITIVPFKKGMHYTALSHV